VRCRGLVCLGLTRHRAAHDNRDRAVEGRESDEGSHTSERDGGKEEGVSLMWTRVAMRQTNVSLTVGWSDDVEEMPTQQLVMMS
jgi:hypothetical protein